MDNLCEVFLQREAQNHKFHSPRMFPYSSVVRMKSTKPNLKLTVGAIVMSVWCAAQLFLNMIWSSSNSVRSTVDLNLNVIQGLVHITCVTRCASFSQWALRHNATPIDVIRTATQDASSVNQA